MNKIIMISICVLVSQTIKSQVILDADGPGNTYELITSVLAPGHNPIEVPDCNHSSFGDHITEIYDNTLNTNVFKFFVHKDHDNDRCQNFDRQRNEIKTYDRSPDNLLGTLGETVEYKWKFKLSSGFQSSSSFSHLHQLKAVGGSEAGMPLITFTTRAGSSNDKLQLRYARSTNQETILEKDLTPFLGEWVEAIEVVTYGDNNLGKYSINIKRIRDGRSLFDFEDNSIRMWKTDADFMRPKWGIYRSLNHPEDLRDETILYANFSIKEIGGLGTNTFENENVKSFPNPVSNKLTIESPKNKLENAVIYSLDGKIINKIEFSFTNTNVYSINTSQLTPAVYLIILTANNKQKLIRKIVKQ